MKKPELLTGELSMLLPGGVATAGVRWELLGLPGGGNGERIAVPQVRGNRWKCLGQAFFLLSLLSQQARQRPEKL